MLEEKGKTLDSPLCKRYNRLAGTFQGRGVTHGAFALSQIRRGRYAGAAL